MRWGGVLATSTVARRQDDDNARVGDLILVLGLDPCVAALGIAIVLAIVPVVTLRWDDNNPRILTLPSSRAYLPCGS